MQLFYLCKSCHHLYLNNPAPVNSRQPLQPLSRLILTIKQEAGSAGWCECVHTCLYIGALANPEWTLISTPPPREELGVHLVAILSQGGIKIDLMETWRGIQRGHRTKRKMYNDPRCHSHDFWTALVTCNVLQRRWRIVSLVMHHKCNTIWECSSHTQ